MASGLSVLRSIYDVIVVLPPLRMRRSRRSLPRCHTRPVSSLSVIITANNTGGSNHLHFERNTWFKPLSNREVRGVSCGARVISWPEITTVTNETTARARKHYPRGR